MSRMPLMFTALALAIAVACGGPATPETKTAVPASAAPTSSVVAPARANAPAPTRPRIVFLGDSLTAGLGLDAADTYVSLLQRRLDTGGYPYEVVNAGVSGDTSAGGRRRLEWSIEGDVRILVLALGANDGLRGLPARDMKANLEAIIEAAQARGIEVILAGMEAPPNNGPEYTAEFRAVYPELAKAHDLRLIPFLLQGVAGEPSLNQADGIHPNVRGARIVADVVWAALQPALAAATPVAR